MKCGRVTDSHQEHHVTATDQMNISAEALAEASLMIAEAFGLGDDADPTNAWPVEEGDAVLAATVDGVLQGELLLAVNEEVIGRITSDPERLRSAFQSALDHMTAALGVELTVGDTTSSESTPMMSAEIRDGNKLCALFGVALRDAAEVAAAADGDAGSADGGRGEAAFADAFEPSMLAPGMGNGMGNSGPLNVLHDVEMDVTVELGRTTMPIRELLALQPGMVVEIDRAAGAPIDVLVNGHLIACGEVVVIDEEFGIRITEIVADGNTIG